MTDVRFGCADSSLEQLQLQLLAGALVNQACIGGTQISIYNMFTGMCVAAAFAVFVIVVVAETLLAWHFDISLRLLNAVCQLLQCYIT